MINGCIKGKTGEREFAKYLRSKGYAARRGQQFSGSPDSPDVVSDLPFHIEVKRCERLNIEKAMVKAIEESEGKPPLIAHRKNLGEWLATLRMDDLIKAIKPLTVPTNEEKEKSI